MIKKSKAIVNEYFYDCKISVTRDYCINMKFFRRMAIRITSQDEKKGGATPCGNLNQYLKYDGYECNATIRKTQTAKMFK